MLQMTNETIFTGYRPRKLQAVIHRALKRFSVLVCHRRFGKTILAVNTLIDSALRCKLSLPRFAYIAPLYGQAKKIAWGYLQHYSANIPGTRKSEAELFVEYANGARVSLFGADNPDSMRGIYLDGAVLDEVAQMKPMVWGEIIRPELVDREGWAMFIGTPKGVNLFHELYQQAIRDPGWYAGLYRASETGVIPQSELDAARSMMSEAQYAQEFECDFSAANEDVLIGLYLVQEAAIRTHHISSYNNAPVVIGVDVARFGDDRSVIAVRQGLQMLAVKKFRDIDTARFGDLVIAEALERRANAVFVDVVGVGAGVVDYMRRLGHKVIAVNGGSTARNAGKYMNHRAEMWGEMKDWLEAGGAIVDDLELKADLVSLTYGYDNQGRIKLERKEDAKKRGISSPDCGDALAMTFAAPVAQQTELERFIASQPEKPEARYWRGQRH